MRLKFYILYNMYVVEYNGVIYTSGLTGSSMPTTAMQTSCDTTSSSLSQSGSCVTTTSPGCVTAVPAETRASSLIPSPEQYCNGKRW